MVLADKQMRKYYALIGAEGEIGSAALTWSRARTFNFNKNPMGKAIVYATGTCLHLSVHGTAPPVRCQAGQPVTSAECFMHGAAHALHSAPPHPAVNVGGGAHSVSPSAPATHPGAFGEAEVVADDIHAASSVSADDWLAATVSFSSGDFNAGGTSARAGNVDDGLFPSLAGRDKSASPSSYLHTLPDDDDDITPLLSHHNAASGGSGSGEFFDGVDCGVTQARLHVDTHSDDNDHGPADVLEELLGHMSQREDVDCVDDRVDVSVGVSIVTCVGVGVSGLGVSLGVGLGVGLVVAPPPLTSLDS